MGPRPQDRKESDTAEQLSTHRLCVHLPDSQSHL